MKFELTKLTRDVDNQELINDLKRVALKLASDSLTREEYKQNGRFGISTLDRRLGTWSDILKNAGLKNGDSRSRAIFNDAELINDLVSVAQSLKTDSISRDEYKLNGGKYSTSIFEERFGSWVKAKERAGLKRKPHPRVSDEEYFINLQNVWIKLGRQPLFREMSSSLSKYSGNAYQTRFGSWYKALELFIQFIEQHDSSFASVGVDLDKAHNPSIPTSARESLTNPGKIKVTGHQKSTNELNNATPEEPAKVRTEKTTQQKIAKDTHKTKRNINGRLQVKVLIRDGNRCKLCGVTVTGDDIHFDHIIPWSKGGETTFENIQVLCAKHNLAKGDYHPT